MTRGSSLVHLDRGLPSIKENLASPISSNGPHRASSISPTATTLSVPTCVYPTALSQSSHRKKNVDLELKRKRNREWMRKARSQQKCKMEAMKDEIRQLEQQLEQIRRRVEGSERANAPEKDRKQKGSNDSITPLCKAKTKYSVLLATAQRLREERNWLREELCTRERGMSTVSQLLDEMKVSCAPLGSQGGGTSAASLGQAMSDDPSNQWVNESLSHFFHPIPSNEVYAMVRQGYNEIMQVTEWADSFEPIGSVLGWENKRLVSNNRVDFMLRKEFFHENTDALLQQAWANMSDEEHTRQLEPSVRSMKLLQRVNDDVLIFARNLSFPNSDNIFCTMFLLFRIQTPQGYIIGTRSIRPPNPKLLEEFLGGKLVYTDLSYAMIFSRILLPTEPLGELAECGCTVKFGGRMGNGTLAYAQTMAMNVMLIILRWESSHIGPIYKLSSDDDQSCTSQPYMESIVAPFSYNDPNRLGKKE